MSHTHKGTFKKLVLDEDAMPAAKVGDRVQVFTMQGGNLGYGTYMGIVLVTDIDAAHSVHDLDLPDDDVELTANEEDIADVMLYLAREEATTAILLLDTGQTIYGLECPWTLVEEASHASN